MQEPAVWEMILAGAVALLVVFWFRPGIQAALDRSRQAEKDWRAVLIPFALVILFVLFLIVVTQN